jgi:hypothetical protein
MDCDLHWCLASCAYYKPVQCWNTKKCERFGLGVYWNQ